ncbi:hypothetical protein ACQCN2_20055 [Brevibacillus ginsengisoli]|uniref:hypothetical protein n=1 Tax=Brevibacillus ginsengisoli TaxID=363854 RepID=UPI003CF53594
MQGIVFSRRESEGNALLEYSFYDNKFASGNLVVRKVFMAMLSSVRERLTHLEVEYNDRMLAETLGKRAGEFLRLLGVTKENLRDNIQGSTVVSRTFRSEMNEERYNFFYYVDDLARLPHYSLMEEEQARVVFYFSQYLLLRIPLEEEEHFYQQLTDAQVPYEVIRK